MLCAVEQQQPSPLWFPHLIVPVCLLHQEHDALKEPAPGSSSSTQRSRNRTVSAVVRFPVCCAVCSEQAGLLQSMPDPAHRGPVHHHAH
jgi:hypothetical protein